MIHQSGTEQIHVAAHELNVDLPLVGAFGLVHGLTANLPPHSDIDSFPMLDN